MPTSDFDKSTLRLQLPFTDYEKFVEENWFYDPAEHGGMPELGYTALKLVGEAGELAEKVAKIYRDSRGVVEDSLPLIKELGDIHYYVVKLAHLLGEQVAGVEAVNVKKLQDRKARGTMRGSGDDR